jgi:hypothetical protein
VLSLPAHVRDLRGEIPGQQAIQIFLCRRLRPEILTREQALELAKDPSESVATLDRGPRLEDHVTLSELGRIDEAF